MQVGVQLVHHLRQHTPLNNQIEHTRDLAIVTCQTSTLVTAIGVATLVQCVHFVVHSRSHSREDKGSLCGF